MWIVQVALRRPYTFLVMALLIVLATPLILLRMSTDMFPEIYIPVVSIVWTYTGLSAQEVGNRITAVNERGLTTSVNDIQHVESESLAGFSDTNALLAKGLSPNDVVNAVNTQNLVLPSGTVKIGPTECRERAACVRHRQRSLQGRCGHFSRRADGAADLARQSAPGRADPRPAIPDRGLPGQGTGRGMAEP